MNIRKQINFAYPLSNACCTWNNLTSKVIGSRKLFMEELKHYIFAKNIDTHASNIRHFLCPHVIKAKYGGINLHQSDSIMMWRHFKEEYFSLLNDCLLSCGAWHTPGAGVPGTCGEQPNAQNARARQTPRPDQLSVAERKEMISCYFYSLVTIFIPKL